MDGARPPIRTGGATARAPFGGGLTAPGPYGRRVLRPAGAGPRRALPGGFGPVRGRCQSRAAASSARTACWAGWGPNGARVRQRETGPRSNHGDRYRRHGRRDGAGGCGAPGTEFPPSRAAAPLRRPLTQGFPAPEAALRGELCRGSLEASALDAPSPTAGPLCAPPARGAGAPSGRRGVGRPREPLPAPAALPLAEARPVAPARPHPAFVSRPR